MSVVVNILTIVTILSAVFFGWTFLHEDYVMQETCSEDGLHSVGGIFHRGNFDGDKVRCEDDSGNIRWVEIS